MSDLVRDKAGNMLEPLKTYLPQRNHITDDKREGYEKQ
jgi:hypothetical protein